MKQIETVNVHVHEHVLLGIPAQHEVVIGYDLSWAQLKNRELLDFAEKEGFTVLVTADPNFRYQQNLTGRRLATVVVSTISWLRIQRVVEIVVATIDGSTQPEARSKLRFHEGGR